MSKIKNGGLDQYGTERFEQQQLATSGVERVNSTDDGQCMPSIENNDSLHSQTGRCGDAAAGLRVPAELRHTPIHDVDVLEEIYHYT